MKSGLGAESQACETTQSLITCRDPISSRSLITTFSGSADHKPPGDDCVAVDSITVVSDRDRAAGVVSVLKFDDAFRGVSVVRVSNKLNYALIGMWDELFTEPSENFGSEPQVFSH